MTTACCARIRTSAEPVFTTVPMCSSNKSAADRALPAYRDRMSKKSAAKSWYGVRCIFADVRNKPWGPHDLEPGEMAYEERVTLWHAKSFKRAIALAEVDAKEYAEILESEYIGLAQAFRFDGKPKQGAEVFSLIRRSSLDVEKYLDRYFDTGTEYQRQTTDD